LVVLAFAALALAVVTGSLAWSRFSESHSPTAVVNRFFAAVADGDAATALAFSETPPVGQFLTGEVLKRQLEVAKLTDVIVQTSETHGSSATVGVRYRLGFTTGFQDVNDHVELVAHGSSWLLTRVASTVIMDVKSGKDRLTFAGRPVPTDSVTLLPGAVPLRTDTASVIVGGHPSVRLQDNNITVAVRPEVSEPAKKQATQAVDAAFAKCVASKTRVPQCPQVEGARPLPGSLHGVVTKSVERSGATVELSSDSNVLLTITGSADLDGTWQVWDFNNQAVTKHESVTVTLHAQASVDDPGAIYWTAAE
jgi:hypothetical protein